jgi:hypothetical protein
VQAAESVGNAAGGRWRVWETREDRIRGTASAEGAQSPRGRRRQAKSRQPTSSRLEEARETKRGGLGAWAFDPWDDPEDLGNPEEVPRGAQNP